MVLICWFLQCVYSSLALVLSFRTLRNLTRSLSSMELAKDVAFFSKHLAEQPAQRSQSPTNLQRWSYWWSATMHDDANQNLFGMSIIVWYPDTHPIMLTMSFGCWLMLTIYIIHVRITMFARRYQKHLAESWWLKPAHLRRLLWMTHEQKKYSMNGMKKVIKPQNPGGSSTDIMGIKGLYIQFITKTNFIIS